MDVLRDRLAPEQVIADYRRLYADALAEFGPDVYEPYAVLDRLATFFNNKKMREETLTTRGELADALAPSGVVAWRREGEVAKQRGLIALAQGDLAQARPLIDLAAEKLREHPGAADYSYSRVLLAQAEIAAGEKRFDDLENISDKQFRMRHDYDARSLDQLSTDVLDNSEDLAAFHIAYSMARRRANAPERPQSMPSGR
jgi:hypothetical protein